MLLHPQLGFLVLASLSGRPLSVTEVNVRLTARPHWYLGRGDGGRKQPCPKSQSPKAASHWVSWGHLLTPGPITAQVGQAFSHSSFHCGGGQSSSAGELAAVIPQDGQDADTRMGRGGCTGQNNIPRPSHAHPLSKSSIWG